MAKSFSVGKVELVSSTDAVEESASMEPEGPFQILVLGDFSGCATRGAAAAAVEPGWRPIRIDRDNFDQVMSRLGVELWIAAGGDETTPIVLKFQELDDFHPDRILERTEVFQALREKRRALSDPTTFRRAMTEASEPPPLPHQRHAPAGTAPASPADLLDQILAQTSGPTADSPRPQPRLRDEGPWEALLEKITASYRVPGADPQQAEMVASVDAATSQLLRDILHHRDFQALEAAWRGLYFLTHRLDTDGPLSISLLDLTRDELADDLASAPNLESTKLYARTSEDCSTQRSWAVLIGSMEFAPEPADLAFLSRMAGIARAAGAPFLAAASPRFLGCDCLAETPDPSDWQPESSSASDWNALRSHPDARFVGLALPRFLLRLPYGKDAQPIESFDFEELVAESVHGDFLWGNPALALAELLGRSFNEDGWRLRPGSNTLIEELPLYIDHRGDEPEATPCAEVLLTDRVVETIVDRGLMLFRSIRNRDAISLARFQSISEPAQPLAGRWG
jgi:type VI secretion system protein ImpC